MNIVQVQERLKDLPTDVVVAYSNGSNLEEVPPYIALAELHRRTRVQQQQTQLPQGTVKDKIEGGLMALKKQATDQMMMSALKQQQMAQNQAGQAMQQPMPVPAGVPQPEMEEEMMAAGGIAEILVPDEAMEYGSGGIVAFADRGLVEDVYAQDIPGAAEYRERQIERDRERKRREEEERDEFLQRAGSKRISSPLLPEGDVEVGRGGAYRGMRTEVPMNVSAPSRTAPVAESTRRVTLPNAAGVPAAQMPPVVPVAGVPGAAQAAAPTVFDFRKMLIEQATKEPDRSRLTELEQDPYAKKQPGERLEQYIKRMEERAAAEDTRFAEMEKERARSALWRGLMAAGEASRGQRGIGALMGGFGKVAGEEMEAGRMREESRIKARREQQDAIVKMQQEIENARIARARGDIDEERKRLADAEKYRRDAMMKGAEQQAADEREQRRMANEQELARIRFEYDRRLRQTPQAERPTLQREYAEELVKRGTPRDQAIREALTLGQESRRQMTFDQALDNARAEFKDQNPYVWQNNENKKAKEEGRQPRTYQQAITDRANEIMRGASGAPAASSTGPKEGETSKSNSGKPIIFRNGRWEYQ